MVQIATAKIETQGSGTVTVPVFELGDSGSSVLEIFRLETGSGTGFIPLVDPANSNFPYLRVQSQNQGVVAVHNEVALTITADVVYNEGTNEDLWTESNRAFGSGSVSKNADNLFAQVDGETQATAERAWRTTNAVDMSGHSTLEFEWKSDTLEGVMTGDVATENDKDFQPGPANSEASVVIDSGSFSRRTDTLDVSSFSDPLYIRMGIRDDALFEARPGEYNAYRVELL